MPDMRLVDDIGMFPIMTVGACEEAANTLGLSDTPAFVTTNSPRPEGCYWKSSTLSLRVATNPANQGNGADGDRHPICMQATVAGSVMGSFSGHPLPGSVYFLLGILIMCVMMGLVWYFWEGRENAELPSDESEQEREAKNEYEQPKGTDARI